MKPIRHLSHRYRTGLLVVLLLLLYYPPLHAIDFAGFSAEALHNGTMTIRGLTTEIDWQDDHNISLAISMDAISTEDTGELRNVSARCIASIQADASLQCTSGSLRAEHDRLGVIKGSLGFHLDERYTVLSISVDASIGDNGYVRAAWNRHSREPALELELENIPVTPFLPMLKRRVPVLADYVVSSGEFSMKAHADMRENRLQRVEAGIDLKALNVEGENVLQDTAAVVKLKARRLNDSWIFSADVLVNDGVMYVIPGFEVLGDTPGFYIDATTSNLGLVVAGRVENDFSRLALEMFDFHHEGLLQVGGRARLEFANIPRFEFLELDIDASDLASIFPIYVEPLLLATNFANLELAGALQLDLRYTGNELRRLGLRLTDVYLDDDRQRFSVSGLNSDLFIGESVRQRVSSIDWQSLSLYKLIFGAGDITLVSGNNHIEVVDWRDVAVLDGQLLINHLSLSGIGRGSFKLSLNGELTPISLKTFTQTMGWPLMDGRLSGTIEDLEYSEGDLTINSDLKFRVFDGDVVLQNLVVDNLFERTARLYTNVEIDNLDLEQLTGTFSFGRIKGSLDGYVRDLTLLNWKPVYFDAVLKNPADDDRPHRISQKALDNLSEIGGGLPGALSKGFMRFIPEYSYGRLGIRCLLSNGVCNLGGVERTEDGFYIMTRGGLLPPWVDVKGTGRSIVWKELIAGLKRIAEGDIAIE